MEIVPVIVVIRENKTNRIRFHLDNLFLGEDKTPNIFIWEDGNYACDCNRGLFFDRAGNDEEREHECSQNTGDDYSVNILLQNGECIYSEFGMQILIEPSTYEETDKSTD